MNKEKTLMEAATNMLMPRTEADANSHKQLDEQAKIKVVYVQKIGGKQFEVFAKEVKFDMIGNTAYLLIGNKEQGMHIPLSHVIEIVPG